MTGHIHQSLTYTGFGVQYNIDILPAELQIMFLSANTAYYDMSSSHIAYKIQEKRRAGG